MANISHEVVETWPFWERALCRKAKAADQKACADLSSVVTLQSPLMCCIVPSCRVDSSVVKRIFTNIQDLVTMPEVRL